MIITREDAELVAAAMGCTVEDDDQGYTLRAINGEFWSLDEGTIFDHYIIDLARRAGPKPRIAEDEASIISAWLNLSYQSAGPEYVFQQFNDNFDTVAHMVIRFDSPLWNKLLKLAKEAKD